MEKETPITEACAKQILIRLLRLAKLLSSKYSRSRVRKAMSEVFRYVIDELLHAQPDEDQNRYVYHAKILDTIWETGAFRPFVYALTNLIKRLAVDHLHIVGDIYDRGAHADKIMELDNEFHEKLYSITNKMQCYYLIKLMNIHYDRIRELNLRSFNSETIIKEHKYIVECFKAKDSDAAKASLLKHLERHYNWEDEIRKKYPDYFA